MTPFVLMFSGLTFLDPAMLWLGGFVALALWILSRRERPAVIFAPSMLLETEHGGKRRILPLVPLIARAFALLLIVIALARPVRMEQLPATSDGIDVMLCLDVSSSMQAGDMDAELRRLDLAVAAAGRFSERRENDRLGLITFARYPDLRCPLTLDRKVVAGMLARTDLVAAEGPEDATAIGLALTRAAEALSADRTRSRVIIILTDGAENVATAATPNEIAPAHAAQLCKGLGIRVHAIVAGTGALDADGVFRPVDTTQVELVAERTGGGFFGAEDEASLARVFRDIDQLEKRMLDEPRYVARDVWSGFVVAALLIILVAGLFRPKSLEVAP